MDLYSFVTTGKSTQVIGRKTFLISGRGIYPVQDELPANVQKSILEMTCVLPRTEQQKSRGLNWPTRSKHWIYFADISV